MIRRPRANEGIRSLYFLLFPASSVYVIGWLQNCSPLDELGRRAQAVEHTEVLIRERWLRCSPRHRGVVSAGLAEIYGKESLSMKSLKFRFLKQVLPSSAVAVALLGLVAITSPARADSYVLCPSAANAYVTSGSITNVPGPLDGSCGADSAVKLSIPTETQYGRLRFDSGVAGYPTTLTFGNLVGLSADVPAFTGQPGDQPYYMLAFTDATQNLGETAAGDQILMLEFGNPANLVGTTMAVDPNLTTFNLYDNDTSTYLQGGQGDARTIAAWLTAHSFLASELLLEVRTGIGLAGGGISPESLTVNSLTITTAPSAVPEPTSLLLLLTVVGATGLGIRRKQARNPRG